jgi:hypothetical protein
VTAYIFDSHRPYQHTNINDESKRIFCVDDGCKSFTECPTAQDIQEYFDLMQDEGSQEDEDEDDSSNSEAEENGQDGSMPVNDELEMDQMLELEEVKQELQELKDSEEEEEMYEGLKNRGEE